MKRYVLLLVVLTIVAAACAADWMLRHARHGTASSPVEAIKAVRGEGVVDYVIHERETSGGVLVFYLQTAEDGRVATSVEFVRKVGKGWKWEHGGGRSQSDIRLNMTDEEARDAFYFAELISPGGSRRDSAPFPLIYGVAVHPDIFRIVVKDRQSGLRRQADIVEITGKFKLFYAILGTSQPQGPRGPGWEVIGLDREGNEIRAVSLHPSRSNFAEDEDVAG